MLRSSIEALFVLAAIRDFRPSDGWLIVGDSAGQLSFEARDGAWARVDVVLVGRSGYRRWRVRTADSDLCRSLSSLLSDVG